MTKAQGDVTQGSIYVRLLELDQRKKTADGKKWDQFQIAPRHPKWRDVNLGATVPGWNRHTIAEQMLARFHGPSTTAQGDISSDFQAFLNRAGTGAPQSQTEREALFRQFMQWREKPDPATPQRANP